MSRDLTRDDLRALVKRGLTHTFGSYRLLVQTFNMPPDDYKKFLAFLHRLPVLHAVPAVPDGGDQDTGRLRERKDPRSRRPLNAERCRVAG